MVIWITALAVIVALFAAVELGALGGGGGGGGGGTSSPVYIVNGSITIGALNSTDYRFSVPAGASGVSVKGSFTASGGTGHDIGVLIMNSTVFTDWQDGSPVSVYYDSTLKTSGTISVALPAGGTYCLVYFNAERSPTNVQTTVSLTYTG